MNEPKSIDALLAYRVLRLSNTLALYSSRRYRDLYGVTLPEWRAMSIIATRGTTSAREISRILATDKGWVGLSVESLERRGYLTRTPDPRDARRTLLRLTPVGQQKHDEVLAEARQRQRRLLSTLSPEDAERLVTSLDRLQAEAELMLRELDDPDASRVAPT